MMFKFRVLRDPGEVDPGGAAADEPQSIQDAVMQGFEQREKEATSGADPAKEPAAAEDPAKAEKPKEPAAAEDPEFELDYEDEPGKGKAKAKLSELKKIAKWLKDNNSVIQGAFGVREAANKNPEFAKLLQTVISKSFDEKGTFNQAETTRLLSVLDAKVEAAAEKIETKIDDQTDEIKAMEADLEDLDPESPQGRILKRSIASAKALRSQLQNALKQNQEFQKRLDGFETNLTAEKKQKEDSAREAGVTRLAGIFDSEIASLTAQDKADGLKFFDADERSDFDKAVREAVAKRAGECKSDDDFKRITRECAKVVHQKMEQRRTAVITDYLKRKNQNPADSGKPPEKPTNQDPGEEKSAGESFAEIFAPGAT